jgi:hypothetical protein
MAFSLTDIKTELDGLVNEATSFADVVDKYADLASKFAGDIPEVGPEVADVVKVIDALDKALHDAQAVLEGAGT